MLVNLSAQIIFILVSIDLWRGGVSEPSDELRSSNSGSDLDTKESIIVGVPVPVEKSAFPPSGQNVFFLVRNPGQFPGAIERLVERIQGYFSSYNSIEALNDRERPQGGGKKNSTAMPVTDHLIGQVDSSSAGYVASPSTSAPIGSVASYDPLVSSPFISSSSLIPAVTGVTGSPVTSDAKQVEFDPTLIASAGDPDSSRHYSPMANGHSEYSGQSEYTNRFSGLFNNGEPVYEITIGPDLVQEPPESYATVPNQAPFVPVSYLPPVVEESANEIQPLDGNYPLTQPIPTPTDLLLPPYEEPQLSGAVVPPCTTTRPPTAYLPPEIPDVTLNEVETSSPSTSTSPVPQEYIPVDEMNIEGPYIYERPTTTSTTTTTTPKPITEQAPYFYERPSTTTSTGGTPCIHSESTTTHKPTCKYSETTTTPKPTTTSKPTTTTQPTKPPCKTSTTTTPKPTTPRTKPTCHTTTTTTTTTTTVPPPCHTTTTTAKSPCSHELPKDPAPPSWSYLPPEKPSPPANAYLPPTKPFRPPHEPFADYQGENHIHIHWRPLFRHRPKFLFPLKRFLGLI